MATLCRTLALGLDVLHPKESSCFGGSVRSCKSSVRDWCPYAGPFSNKISGFWNMQQWEPDPRPLYLYTCISICPYSYIYVYHTSIYLYTNTYIYIHIHVQVSFLSIHTLYTKIYVYMLEYIGPEVAVTNPKRDEGLRSFRISTEGALRGSVVLALAFGWQSLMPKNLNLQLTKPSYLALHNFYARLLSKNLQT